jgi:gliding motility-associated-like protein
VAPKPVVTISGNPNGCLNALSTFSIPQATGVSYQYAVTNGVITNQSPGHFDVLWISNGTHQVTVDAVNLQTGCQSQNRMDVTIDPLPVPVVDASMFSGCSPMHVSFADNADSSDYHYTWNFGDGSLSYMANPDHIFSRSGQFPIEVIVTNASGCKDSAVSIVNVFPSPVSEFVPSDDKIYAEYQELTFDNRSQGAVSYQWNFGNGDSSIAFEPSKLFDSPGKYDITLDVTNSYGCRHSTHRLVEVIVPENIFIPNAFTPDGDAKNDYFSVAFHNISEAHIAIFNRWGELIYETDDMDFRWDGKYNGSRIQNEVYVYVINAVGLYGTSINRIGHVTVIK